MIKPLTIKFAERCAWRAVYVYRNRKDGGQRKVFHISVDPTFSTGPKCSGSILSFSWCFTLPHLKWKYPAGPVRRWAQNLSSRFWSSLDGRRRTP